MKTPRKTIPIIALTLFSLALRIIFYIGVGSLESLQNVQAAWTLVHTFKSTATQLAANGVSIAAWIDALAGLQTEFGFAQILALLPTSIMFWVFGASEWSGVFVALTSSLLATVFVYLIAEMLYGRRVAMVAGMVWALLPLGISSATQAVVTQQLVMLFVFGVYLLLKMSEWGTLFPFLILGILMAVLGLMSTPFGVALIGCAIIIFGSQFFGRPFIFPIFAGGLTVLFTLSRLSFAPNVSGFFERLLGEPGLNILFPLAIVVLSQASPQSRVNQRWVKLLAAVAPALLLLEFAQVSVSASTMDGLLLLMWLPVVLLTATKVTSHIPEQRFVEALGILGFSVLLGAWQLKAGQQLVPNLSGMGWISAGGLYYGLRVLAGLVLLAIVLSPLIFDPRNDSRQRGYWGLAFFAGLSLALLLPTWRYIVADQAQYLAVRQAVKTVNQATENNPQYFFSNRQLFAQVNFLEGFALNAEDKDYVVGEKGLRAIESGNYLYWDTDISKLPERGAIQEVFGQPGHQRLVWLAVLDRLKAQQELLMMEVTRNSMEVFSLAQNAGNSCAAIDAWVHAMQDRSNGHDIAMLRVSDIDNCYQVGHENKVDWLFDPNNYYPTYIQRQELDLIEFENPVIRTEAKYTFFDDPRIWSIETVVEPNSTYYYAVTINAREPVMILYWEFDGQEDYAYQGTYTDFVELSIILVTPDWDSAQTVRLSPALAGHYGFISIANFQFEKIENQK